MCKICFESFSVQDMACARCKHYYCKVNSGGGCLFAFRRCAHRMLPRLAARLLFCRPELCLRLLLVCGCYSLQDCWRGYIHTSIESGPFCLDLRCPDPGG